MIRTSLLLGYQLKKNKKGDKKTKCKGCNDEFEEINLIYVESDDNHYCNKCLEQKFEHCNHCEIYCIKDRATFVESANGFICQTCLDNHYTYCNDCDEYYIDNRISYNEIYDINVCEYCNENYYYCEECNNSFNSDDFNSNVNMCCDCANELITLEDGIKLVDELMELEILKPFPIVNLQNWLHQLNQDDFSCPCSSTRLCNNQCTYRITIICERSERWQELEEFFNNYDELRQIFTNKMEELLNKLLSDQKKGILKWKIE